MTNNRNFNDSSARIWGFMVLFYLFWMPSVVLADLPDTVKQIRGSIVAIGTILPTRTPKALFKGTGFVVGDGHYVVTNHHVIPEILDYERLETLVIFTGKGKNAKGRPAKIVLEDAIHDLVLLEIKGEPLPALILENELSVREGALYAFTGFPIGMVLGLYPVTHQGIVSAITPIVIPAINSKELEVKHIRRMKNPFDVFQLDATAYPGNSGSPLYDVESGRVVGVVNSVLVKDTKESALKSPTGISYAIPVKYIKNLLDRLQL